MIVDKIGVSQIQAQARTKQSGRVPALRFDADPIEPIRPYKPPSRDATADQSGGRPQAERQQAERQQTERPQDARTDGNAAIEAQAPKFSLDGQVPAETISPATVGGESFAGLPGEVLAQQVGSTFGTETGAFPSSGGRSLARNKGASLYSLVQETTNPIKAETRDNLDFWADGVVSQSRNPINLFV